MADQHEPDDLDLLIEQSEKEFPGFTERLRAEVKRQNDEAAREAGAFVRQPSRGRAPHGIAKSKGRVRELA